MLTVPVVGSDQFLPVRQRGNDATNPSSFKVLLRRHWCPHAQVAVMYRLPHLFPQKDLFSWNDSV